LKIHYLYRRWSNLGEHGMNIPKTWIEVGLYAHSIPKTWIEVGLYAHSNVLRAINCSIPVDIVWLIQHLLLAFQENE
jgi:hypothetical protein